MQQIAFSNLMMRWGTSNKKTSKNQRKRLFLKHLGFAQLQLNNLAFDVLILQPHAILKRVNFMGCILI
ncbi:hypothetical protein ASE74_12665 [Pedobacter sp. Leaf216]|uniref:hypothetical protein n=1 Tax=Pedobacter sp. Leaf216 TaxID=1735684 RepID=UPI000700036C|nr:hypothetical protein [Pedobacter sp. Leaf216]KQM78810.1 hypothetical protein ASE74_12665 [Pedobacter sp. Leaf216]RYD69414.1 MAG: hypothetical protein EOP53_27200 [Sphingobacteriales bacterium]